jgi:hypothetical protein
MRQSEYEAVQSAVSRIYFRTSMKSPAGAVPRFWAENWVGGWGLKFHQVTCPRGVPPEERFSEKLFRDLKICCVVFYVPPGYPPLPAYPNGDFGFIPPLLGRRRIFFQNVTGLGRRNFLRPAIREDKGSHLV